ncbi:MAG: endonuclease VIII [Candidatus Eisenbacteria bacterium]|uniref:DNA-(apurinic or apyrimidinic site) lyase n=1 Tax=Eiseniibacteriota bacterium TaxID=2212470 RepID=A0A7Y2ECK5_UNCEI|nr:endonuclease VIII [Candidatus Eisenbacteria bacterium]
MPEGPEIRLAADAVAKAIEGHRAEKVEFGLPYLQEFEDTLSGRKIQSVSSWGKAMLIRFTGGWTLYSHNQLYGKWFVRRRDNFPKTGRQLRVAIHNKTHSALLYSASEIEVLRESKLTEHAYLGKLGPDILDPKLRPASIAKRLHQKPFLGRSLGALFLDQGFLAGVGNYLRSEMLFEAGLLPARKAKELDEAETKRLGKAVRLIGKRAYEQKGICVDLGSFKKYRELGERRGTARYSVFARQGRSCRACGNSIAKLMVAGRRLYLCDFCQI